MLCSVDNFPRSLLSIVTPDYLPSSSSLFLIYHRTTDWVEDCRHARIELAAFFFLRTPSYRRFPSQRAWRRCIFLSRVACSEQVWRRGILLQQRSVVRSQHASRIDQVTDDFLPVPSSMLGESVAPMHFPVPGSMLGASVAPRHSSPAAISCAQPACESSRSTVGGY